MPHTVYRINAMGLTPKEGSTTLADQYCRLPVVKLGKIVGELDFLYIRTVTG